MLGSNGERQLQVEYGSDKRAQAFYNNQMLDHLNEMMQRFIEKQELMFISTSDADGNCDSSFRAGNPGFLRVIDSGRVMYPEYRGNGVYASLGNIKENPHIGLMLIDFYVDCIGLHINGYAQIIENEQLPSFLSLSDQMWEEILVAEMKRPERWVVVDVHEAYIHCSKHIPLLEKKDKTIHWGTDDQILKGGNYFATKQSNKEKAENSF